MKTPGQIAYEAFEDADGLDLPRRIEFNEMTGNMRFRWEAAAAAVTIALLAENAGLREKADLYDAMVSSSLDRPI